MKSSTLPEITTALPEIKTTLLKIETALPEIEILFNKVENNYQPNEGSQLKCDYLFTLGRIMRYIDIKAKPTQFRKFNVTNSDKNFRQSGLDLKQVGKLKKK